MLTRITCGVLAIVLLALGVSFTIVGLVIDHTDRNVFLWTGLSTLALGLLLAAAYAVLRRHAAERRRRAREGPRTSARIVQARYRPGVRVGSTVAFELTVEYVPAGTASRMVLVMPGTRLKDGDTIEVAYDPDEPQNFEPLIDGLV